jgi:hypothetical protein
MLQIPLEPFTVVIEYAEKFCFEQLGPDSLYVSLKN